MNTFRARILLLVAAVALPPLFIVGTWFVQATARSVDRAAHARLADTAERAAAATVRRWVEIRYDLLRITESDASQMALATSGDAPAVVAARLDSLHARVAASVLHARLVRADGSTAWQAGSPAEFAVVTRLPVYAGTSSRRIGMLETSLHAADLLAANEAAGTLVSLVDPATGKAPLAFPFDYGSAVRGRIQRGNEEWVVVRRPMIEPRVDLLAAAPLPPYLLPLRNVAQRSVLLLVLTSLAALAVGWLWSGRLTGTLDRLSLAAADVAAGNLDRRVDVQGSAELRGLGDAFNRMAAQLRSTLSRLAKREAMAAVGEYSAELAHEIRNPLTAIRLDLQYVEERLPQDAELRSVQAAARAEIDRLSDTLTGTLLVARGRARFARLDARDVVTAACATMRAAYRATNVTLDVALPDTPLEIDGDAAGLERLLLNLLANARDAADDGGHVSVAADRDDGHVIVNVRDDGAGIDRADVARIFEPGHTTKAQGAGLGLPIAQRIAQSHGGALVVESTPGAGAVFRLVLPAAGATDRDGL